MKLTLFFLIACISLVGCKSNVAVRYNDMIVDQQNKLKSAMDDAEPKLKNYFATFEYDSIANVSTRMEAQLDAIITQIQKEPAPKAEQGDNFKKAALTYFNYFKAIYDTYKNYGLETTPEGRLYAGQDMTEILKQENKMIGDMLEAQRVFAKDNNFTIREVNPANSVAKK
jgi:hypothetical protein